MEFAEEIFFEADWSKPNVKVSGENIESISDFFSILNFLASPW